MRSFLAVSVAPGSTSALRHPVDAAVRCLADAAVSVDQVDDGADGWLAFAGAESRDAFDGGAFTVRLGRAARTATGDATTEQLIKLVATESGLIDVVPPFALAHRAAGGAPVIAAVDWLGLRQLYWWQGDGVAAISTSARALAELAGAGYDQAGLAAQAMIGWQIGEATVFSGVSALPPATIATLDGGTISLRQYAGSPRLVGPAPKLDDAVDEMADILRRWIAAYLSDHPDSVLQLTGGHDSRILLAAIAKGDRAGLRTLTLGDPTSPDVRIAAELSQRYGMRHQVRELDQELWPTPEQAHRLAIESAHALETMASPLALTPLLLAEARLEQGHRLSGLGGEVARGFYYAGQPSAAQTSPRLVQRLARWRVFANEMVEETALEPAFYADAQATTLARLQDIFTPGDWLRATDDFYLFNRMHRWSGTHSTVATVRRHFINPMFDRRFIELALAVAPADKRDSLLLGRLAQRLDPELAAIPLDSGLAPSRLGTRSPVTRVATSTLTARKVLRKVSQRLSNGRRPQLGAGQASALVLEHWRSNPAACAALYDLPFLRHQWLDEVLAGQRAAAPTTAAFLVNLVAAKS